MKTIFQRMRAKAPKILLVSVLFIVVTYGCMFFETYDRLPGWLHIIWYILVFFAVYLALFSLVVIIVDRLKKLKGDRQQ